MYAANIGDYIDYAGASRLVRGWGSDGNLYLAGDVPGSTIVMPGAGQQLDQQLTALNFVAVGVDPGSAVQLSEGTSLTSYQQTLVDTIPAVKDIPAISTIMTGGNVKTPPQVISMIQHGVAPPNPSARTSTGQDEPYMPKDMSPGDSSVQPNLPDDTPKFPIWAIPLILLIGIGYLIFGRK